MKRIMLRLFLLVLFILPLQVDALSVDKNSLTIEKGKRDTVLLYADVSEEITEVSFSLVYTTYDVPANFNVEAGLKDELAGIKHRIVFSVPVTGQVKLGSVNIDVVNNPKVTAGVVNIHSAKAITSSGETINLDTQIINVTINSSLDNTQTEPDNIVNTDNKDDNKGVNKNLLSKIDSQLVKINLKDDVYEYNVRVNADITELDLQPVAKEESYKVDVSSQKISELDDGYIIITVKDGDNTEEYKIKVDVIEEAEVEIDTEEFESTFKYKGKWVALIIVMSLVLVVGLFLNKK